MAEIRAHAVGGLPEIAAGDDLALMLVERGVAPAADQIVVVAHKAVSKAEGRTVHLGQVQPGARAIELAAQLDKDARQVQVVLDESEEVVRAQNGVLIVRTHHGFVCANAGVDASNAPSEDTLVLLPRDPDASARRLRARFGELCGTRPAIVISDSFGRAWRLGQTDTAIGCAGLLAMDDWRGRTDSAGRELHATWIATADQVAGAADLVRGKDSREPVVIVAGLGRHVCDEDGPGAASLLRAKDADLFR